MDIAFSALTRHDLPLLGRWLTVPPVARWWADPSDPATLEREYGPRIDGQDPVPTWIVHLHDQPIGLIQWYRYADEPEYLEQVRQILPVAEDAVSIDYLIGEEAALGRGVGPVMIDRLLRQQWAAHPDAGDAVVPVHADNSRSWRALAKAGFTHAADGELDPDNPIDDRRHHIMVRRRVEPLSPPLP